MEANRSEGQNGKGDDYRPISCPPKEHALRDELWRSKTSKKRKAEIEKILENHDGKHKEI